MGNVQAASAILVWLAVESTAQGSAAVRRLRGARASLGRESVGMTKIVALVALLAVCSSSMSKETPRASLPPVEPADTAVQEVFVRAVRDPYRTAYRNIEAATAAMRDKRELAPGAELRFVVVPKRRGLVLEGLTAVVSDTGHSVDVPIDGEGRLAFPAQLDWASKAELVVPVNKNAMSIRPVVRTLGLGAHRRRLGDLRLECEVLWRLEYAEASFAARMALKLVGSPCESPKFGVEFLTQDRLQSATVTENGRWQKLAVVAGGSRFYAPLHDKAWSNNAVVELVPIEEGKPH